MQANNVGLLQSERIPSGYTSDPGLGLSIIILVLCI